MAGTELMFLLGLIFGCLGVLILLIVPARFVPLTAYSVVLATAILSGVAAIYAITGLPIDTGINAGFFIGFVPVQMDALSGWFLMIVGIIMVLSVLYSLNATDCDWDKSHRTRLHYLSLVILYLSLQMVLIVQNGFAFLLAWEVMSLSSAMLLIQNHQSSTPYKSIVSYLVQMHIGGMVLALAFIWVYVQTGSFGFEAITQCLQSDMGVGLFLMFFVGFGLKAEFVPLHGKVPHIYPYTRPHVGAVMSGIMVKMGLYGILRIVWLNGGNWLLLGEIVLSVSVLSAFYGGLYATVHRDLKRLLAYCTIENIGIVGIGIGVGMIGVGLDNYLLVLLGFGGALLHVLNHSLIKTLLFFSGGWATLVSKSNDVDKMGGLSKQMPQTTVLFLIGALAISGFPPFNGFVSEFMMYLGLIDGLSTANIELSSLLVLGLGTLGFVGGLSIIVFTKSFGVMFLGTPRATRVNTSTEASFNKLLPQYIIILLMLSIALLPSFFINAVNGIVIGNFSSGLDAPKLALITMVPQNIGAINIYSVVFLVVVGVLQLFKMRYSKRQLIQYAPTWGCAHQFKSDKMQYTGKSFTKPLSKIFGFVISEQKHYAEINRGEVFPQNRKYTSFYFDFFETKMLDPFLQMILRITNYFKFIQNGRVQSYVLYGIAFIIAIFVLTLYEMLP